MEALREAIAKREWNRRHAIDIRFTLPLYFTRLYFVLLCGRDRRFSQARRYEERIQTFSARFFPVVLALLSIPFVIGLTILLAFFLYFLKSMLGINLLPEHHLIDILEMFWIG